MQCTQSGSAFVVAFNEVGFGKKRHFFCYIQLVIVVYEILTPDSLDPGYAQCLEGTPFYCKKTNF